MFRFNTQTWCIALALCLASTASAGLDAQDVVIQWNNAYIETIRATGGPPCPISRAGAMLHVAIYDAVNSIELTHEPFYVALPASPSASREAAAAAAAHYVLTGLYPSRAGIFDKELEASLDAIPDGAAKNEGVDLGVAVAEEIMDIRAGDGTDSEPPYPEGTKPGEWRSTFPDFTTPPFNPGWGNTVPWTMIAGADLRPGGPAGYTNLADLLASPDYAAQLNEVKELGAKESATRTEHDTETAFFWANDSNGTYKPPGHLNYITQVVSEDHGLSLSENARLFALINVAMADAGLVAWDMKYNADTDLWRPISAIREADTDGNDATEADPEWEPLNPFTPPFPAYVSGHATFGAVHAAVMRGYFGTDDVTFTITSDDTPGVFRTYDRFSDAARENGRSRIFLGVHYQFDADDGYTAGTLLGERIMASHFRPLGRFVRGDANDSSAVNVADAIHILSALYRGGAQPICLDAADANSDKKLSLMDAMVVLNHQFLNGAPPAAPFSSCGTDAGALVDTCNSRATRCSASRWVGDPEWVHRWAQIAVDASGFDHSAAGAHEHPGPCRASRAIAMTQIAVFEAVNAVTGGYESYLGIPPAEGRVSLRAAIAQAAHDTLAALFTAQKATFDEKLEEDLAFTGNTVPTANGVELGKAVAEAILEARANDGSDHDEPLYGVDYEPAPGLGKWRQDPVSEHPLALGARWSEVAPFVMTSADQFRAPVPPAIDSAEYAVVYNEVKALGGDGVDTPTERMNDQSYIGVFWAYDGTPSLCAPPRLYNQIIAKISRERGEDIVDLARLYALANVAMADAGLAIWESKYFYEYWRPVTGIREGASDDNDETAGDSDYTPLGAPGSNLAGPNFTPPFPAYPSGHAGFGGALFQTLRRFYDTDDLSFTFLSDEFNGVTVDNEGNARLRRPRSFERLSQAEEENGQSRIYLGIHWSFDKTEGIAQGNKVGDEVFDNIYLPKE